MESWQLIHRANEAMRQERLARAAKLRELNAFVAKRTADERLGSRLHRLLLQRAVEA
jgi:hypothetical protein